MNFFHWLAKCPGSGLSQARLANPDMEVSPFASDIKSVLKPHWIDSPPDPEMPISGRKIFFGTHLPLALALQIWQAGLGLGFS